MEPTHKNQDNYMRPLTFMTVKPSSLVSCARRLTVLIKVTITEVEIKSSRDILCVLVSKVPNLDTLLLYNMVTKW